MKAVGGRPSFWIGFWMGWVWDFGLAVCTLLALYGWRTYDDEGFMLYPSLQLLEGHSLYSEVFTLYGPVFHLANTGWVWLFGPSMLAARLATTGLAGLSAAFLYAIGRRFMPPLASMVPAMAWLLMASTNLNESLHPGWYSTALTLAAVHLWMRGPAPGSGGRLFGIGLLVGVLGGFKVNVAAFTGFGFAAFSLTACRCPRPLRWLAAAGFAGCLIFLMSADLWPPQRGVYPFLLVITVILFFFRRPSPGLQGSGLKALAWGAAGAAAGVLLWLIPTIRISGLGPAWDMMIVLAARQPRVFSNVGQGPFPSVAVLAALGLWAVLQIRRTSLRPALALLVAAGCGAGVLLVVFPKLLMLLSEAGPRRACLRGCLGAHPQLDPRERLDPGGGPRTPGCGGFYWVAGAVSGLPDIPGRRDAIGVCDAARGPAGRRARVCIAGSPPDGARKTGGLSIFRFPAQSQSWFSRRRGSPSCCPSWAWG